MAAAFATMDQVPISHGEEVGNLKGKKSKQGPRKRVSQACNKCRSRKDKCDGAKPACSTCVSNHRVCSYDANVKKRGLPEGYVRGLEKLWGLAIRDVSDIEDDMLNAMNGQQKKHDHPDWNDETSSDSLVKLWRQSQLSQELERLLSSVEITTIAESSKRKRLDSDTQAGRQGFGAELVPLLTARTEQSESSTSKIDPATFTQVVDHGNVQQSILTPNYAAEKDTSALAHKLIELPSETWHLLDVYFSYTHPWLPIIEKHDLLRTSYQYSQKKKSTFGSGDHATLWAAIAYSKFQHRVINNIPRAQGPVRDMVWTAERMYAHARTLIPNEEGVFELGHIQALLILALTNMGMGYLGRAWLLVGHAVRVATDLQLHQWSDTTSNSYNPKSRAKHVFLGCFVLDTILAARLGHRPHLRADDASEVGLIDEDGLDEWDPWTDSLSVRKTYLASLRVPSSILSTFNQLVQILKILSEAICTFRSNQSLHLSTGLLEKLQIWSRSHSPSDLDSSSNREHAPFLLPHQYHVHVTYLTTLSFCQMLVHDNGYDGQSLEPPLRTARQIAELLKRHSSIYGLLIVPPTYEYFIKSAYDIVNEVRGSIEHTHVTFNDWKHDLDGCLDEMETAWTIFESLRGDTVSHQSPSRRRRESEVAFDLINGMNQHPPQSDSPTSTRTPHSFDLAGQYSPHPMTGQVSSSGNTQRPRTMSHGMGVQPPTSQRYQSFGRTTHGLPQPPSMYQNAQAVLVNRGDQPQVSAVKNAGQQMHRTSLPADSPLDTQFASNLSAISDNDTDPLANEFAALDAMEWTGNWDQSLLNLGFTDRDKMNQDFYAFCQEPDPLHPNTVFQQLVANSNAEATDFFDGSGLGMSMTPGAFGTGLTDEHEGIEAGHILQSLSAAEEDITGEGIT